MFLKVQIEIYQWLVPLIAIFFIYRIIKQFRSNKRLLLGTIIWLCFWLIISILAIFPDLISFSIAEAFGFKSNINAIIFVALGFLFLIVFYLSSSLDRMDRQITELVRRIALENREKMDQSTDDE